MKYIAVIFIAMCILSCYKISDIGSCNKPSEEPDWNVADQDSVAHEALKTRILPDTPTKAQKVYIQFYSTEIENHDEYEYKELNDSNYKKTIDTVFLISNDITKDGVPYVYSRYYKKKDKWYTDSYFECTGNVSADTCAAYAKKVSDGFMFNNWKRNTDQNGSYIQNNYTATK